MATPIPFLSKNGWLSSSSQGLWLVQTVKLGPRASLKTRAEQSLRHWEKPAQPCLCSCHPPSSSDATGRSRWCPRLPCHGAWPELQGLFPLTPTAWSGPGPPHTPSESRPKTGQDCAVLSLRKGLLRSHQAGGGLGLTGPPEDEHHPSMSQLKRWCFTSMS